jgi:hypothetical protein
MDMLWRTTMAKLNIIYANINSYQKRRHHINHFIEKHNINCTLFVETNTKTNSNTSYRNWDIIKKDGYIFNNNTRGGSLIQVNPVLKMRKQRINNQLNE